MKKILIFILLVLIGAGIFLFLKSKLSINQNITTPQADKLQIITTTPNPLDGATILPTQTIIVAFNKPVAISEFKHRFDPEVEHTIETQTNDWKGTTMKITFKKPLQLGSGYTLFIESNTHTEAKEGLDHQYVYHFTTISYKGV
jgi:hypothetical protein